MKPIYTDRKSLPGDGRERAGRSTIGLREWICYYLDRADGCMYIYIHPNLPNCRLYIGTVYSPSITLITM